MPLVARRAISFREKKQKLPSYKHLMDDTQNILTDGLIELQSDLMKI